MVSYDLSRVFGLLPSLLQALPTTLWIMFVTALIGSLLGVCWLGLRLPRNSLLLAWLEDIYLSLDVRRLLSYFSWFFMAFQSF